MKSLEWQNFYTLHRYPITMTKFDLIGKINKAIRPIYVHNH